MSSSGKLPVMQHTSNSDLEKDLTRLHGETWFLVYALMQKLRPYFAAVADQCGLTMQQATALRMIGSQQALAMRELADVLGCDTANLTGVVDRLEAMELVKRSSSEQDRRVKLLELTEKGLRMREQLVCGLEQAQTPIAELSADDQRLLHALLSQMLH